MDGVTDKEARRVLLEHGRTVGKRGGLSAANWREYEQIMAATSDSPAGEDHVTDLGDPAPPPPAASPAGGGRDREQVPRRVKVTTSSPGPGARIRGLLGGRDGQEEPAAKSRPASRPGRAKAARKTRPEQPWRSTASVIETTWTRFAQAAAGIPPLQRVLAAQAPMAGIVLETQLRGTLVDRVVLQRAARWEAQTETLAAMIGVPGLVLLVSARGRCETVQTPNGVRPVIDQDGCMVWDQQTEALMILPLRYCLMSWLAVSERNADAVTAQAEQTIKLGREADKLITWMFGPPPAPDARFKDTAREARERVADFTAAAGDNAPPPGPGPGPGSSSAFRPALTASVLA